MSHTENEFLRRLGKRFGVENELGVEEPTEEVVIPEVPEETVEGSVAETNEVETEVVEETAEAEVTEQAVETLENVAIGLRAALARGGCTPGEAYAYRVAMESALRPFGYSTSVAASLENVGDEGNSRLAATRAALEEADKGIKAWFASAMAQLQKLYETIKGWILKLFDNIPRIKERANELIKRANEAKGGPKQAKLKLGLVEALRVGDGVPAAKDVETGVTGLLEKTNSVLAGKSAEAYKTAVAALVDILKDVSTEAGKMTEVSTKVYAELDKRANAVGATKEGDKDKYGGDGVTAKVTDPMIGGVVIAVRTASNQADGKSVPLDRVVSNSKMSLEKSEVKGDKSAEFEALDANGVKAIAGKVVNICDVVSGYKALWNARDAEKKNLEKTVNAAIDKVIKGNTGEGSKDKNSALKSAASAVTKIWSSNIAFEGNFVSYVSKTIKAALDYCNASVNNIGEGKTEPAKPAEGEGAK